MGSANCSCIIREVDMINDGKMHEVKKRRCQGGVHFIPVPIVSRDCEAVELKARNCWEEIL